MIFVMPIHFQIAPQIPPIKATPRYLTTDYALTVVPDGEFPEASNHRISVDTLTLLFSSVEHVLVGLDAYTNATRWRPDPLSLPPVAREGALICTEDFDENGIGMGDSGPLEYVYAKETMLLRIIFEQGYATNYVRCLSCLVCGLANDGSLIEIWIEGVKG